jgi:hypothetical protein
LLTLPTLVLNFQPTRCAKYPNTSKRDLLVCFLDDTFVPAKNNLARLYNPELSSEMGHFILRVLDFDGIPSEKILLEFNNSNPRDIDCSSRNTHAYMSSNWQMNDIDGNGNTDIALEFMEVSLCDRVDEPKSVDFVNFKIMPVKQQLQWLFDGGIFTPTPETKMFLDNLPKQ